jgi:predicted RNase H-like HicB family nuclease
MITSYIHAAMRRAVYEILEDGTYYGEIPGFQGVYANADNLDCREELQEVLEGWLALGLRLGHRGFGEKLM